MIDAFPRVEDCCAELLHAPIMTHDGNSCQDVTTGNEDGWHPEWKLIFAELEVGNISVVIALRNYHLWSSLIDVGSGVIATYAFPPRYQTCSSA